MNSVDLVDVDILLSDFFKRVAGENNANGQAIGESVIKAIEESGTLAKLETVLAEYWKANGKGQDLYKPLVMLFNKILDVLQEAPLKEKLDEVLKQNKTFPIQFIHYDTLHLRYGLLSGREMKVVHAKPDILIVMKDTIQDYPDDQTAVKKEWTGNKCDFDPSERSENKAKSRIMFQNVLGCVEMKRTTGNVNGTGRDGTPSQSSQLNVPQPSHVSRKRGRLRSSRSASSQKLQETEKGEKTNENKSTADFLQLGNYAAEFLSRGPYVTHNIGLEIHYDKVQICWFDRQNSIVADQFDIFEDFALFVALIASLSRFSLEDWGIDEEFYPGEGHILKVPIAGGEELEVNMTQKPLCHRIALHGRGTMVLRGHLQSADTTLCVPVAVKISYPESSRVPEQVFISEGRNLHSKDGDNNQFYPKIYHVFNNMWTTDDIRGRLGLESKGPSRTRRIIVFELLDDITSLQASDDIRMVWTHCVAAHRDMWNKKYEHGDISIYNLMFRKVIDQGGERIVGVLNDWDLATHRGSDQGEVYGGGAQRTGTIPFVALDLLDDKAEVTYRLYRHDLESAGWCLVYICLDCPDNAAVLREWHHKKTTVNSREAFLRKMGKYEPRKGYGRLYRFACGLIHFLTHDAVGQHWPTSSQTFGSTPVSHDPFDRRFIFNSEVFDDIETEEEQARPEMSNEEIWASTSRLYNTWFPTNING